MTCKITHKFQVLGSIIVMSIMIFGVSNVYAQENSEYKMIEDVSPVLTFTFRDGVETYEFPVFKMGENLIPNSCTTFSVEGTVTDSLFCTKQWMMHSNTDLFQVMDLNINPNTLMLM